jgi:hypothetical protein
MQHTPLEIICLGINLGMPHATLWAEFPTKPRRFAHQGDFLVGQGDAHRREGPMRFRPDIA